MINCVEIRDKDSSNCVNLESQSGVAFSIQKPRQCCRQLQTFINSKILWFASASGFPSFLNGIIHKE